MTAERRILGLDPGLRHLGWGLILSRGSHLTFLDAGVVDSDSDQPMAERLRMLHDGLQEVVDLCQPDEAAIEETFVNKNPNSTLKLGMARGVAMLVPALAGLSVAEYPPNLVKKAVVGAGHADKDQVAMMVRTLLPGCAVKKADALDALAIAICHAHLAGTTRQWVGKALGQQVTAKPLSGGRLQLAAKAGVRLPGKMPRDKAVAAALAGKGRKPGGKPASGNRRSADKAAAASGKASGEGQGS